MSSYRVKNRTRKPSLKNELFQWAQSLIISLIIVILFVTFIGGVANVKGSSMLPTLSNNDRVISTKLYKNLNRGDIVVIKRKNNTALIKRVVAIEGDTINIDFDTGEVFINRVLQDEPYINEATTSDLGFVLPATVPEGHIFVMGDNRNHSQDSRDPSIGMVDKKNVFGKVIYRIFPFNKTRSFI